MLVDQLADDLDRFAGRPGALHGDPRQIAVVGTDLRVFGQRQQSIARRRPDIARRDTVFVQAVIGQRRGETGELGVSST